MLRRLLLSTLSVLFPALAHAQWPPPPTNLTKAQCQSVIASAPWYLLQSRGNTRYASEMLPLHRPSLTFNGFDNTTDGLNPNAGHGLRQALAEVCGKTCPHLSGAFS